MKTAIKTTMKYRRYKSGIAGDARLELTAPWAGLPTGTVLVPLYAGFNNVTNRAERTVMVITGPEAGEQVTGEL